MTYTYEELKEATDKWFDSLSEDVKYQMIKQNDVSFEEYILSQMKVGESVEIDFENYKYEIHHKK